jgi:two-component system, NarL family, sensor kinase
LNSVANALNESVDLTASLSAALSRVAELLDLRTGWVWLLDESSGEPYLAAAQNLPAALEDHPERLEGSCYCLDAYRIGALAGAANIGVVRCSRLNWLREGTNGLRFHASISLYARGAKLGVMNVASSEWRQLSREELQILHTVGDMLGTAVERARLFAKSAEAGAAEERNRLAREIHDTLAQGLAAATLHLETAEALLEAGAEADRIQPVVHQALETTRQNLNDARRSVLDLRATPLQGRTLHDALESLCLELSDTLARGIDFQAVGSTQPLPTTVGVGLYRIAQEALANVTRHAGATSASVRLDARPDRVILTIEDTGRGFDVDEPHPGRFGLTGMSERAKLLGGTLEVESTAGVGTRVRAIVPLTAN